MKRFIIATVFTVAAGAATPSFSLSLADHIGEEAATGSARRTVEVADDTRYLNVSAGEIVNLQFNGQSTTWHFTGIDPVIDLSQIIPGAPPVNVYVARANNRYAP
jgi:hypothetical protein